MLDVVLSIELNLKQVEVTLKGVHIVRSIDDEGTLEDSVLVLQCLDLSDYPA
jgi:hypothetical protein